MGNKFGIVILSDIGEEGTENYKRVLSGLFTAGLLAKDESLNKNGTNKVAVFFLGAGLNWPKLLENKKGEVESYYALLEENIIVKEDGDEHLLAQYVSDGYSVMTF